MKVFSRTHFTRLSLFSLLSRSFSLVPSLSFLVSRLAYLHSTKGPCGARGRKTGRSLSRARCRKQDEVELLINT